MKGPVLAAWAILALPGLAAAQGGPHGHGSSPPLPVPGLAAPTAVDTATVVLEWLADPAPRLESIRPDTVLFGDPLFVTITGTAPPDSLQLPEWLALSPDDLERLPAADRGGGDGFVLPLRVYRLDPFRLQLGADRSPVVTVRGRSPADAQAAGVRSPRAPGWSARFILAVLAAALLVGALVWWILSRRRDTRFPGRNREVAVAAWPTAAIDLARLVEGADGSGDGRDFLDGLSRIARTYVAARFRVNAREMTGPEIDRACAGLAYDPAAGRAFARIIAAVDRSRFEPGGTRAAACRELAADLRAAIGKVMIEPRQSPVPPAELAAGRQAWERLGRLLAREGRG